MKWTTLTDLRHKLIARWNSGELLAELIEPQIIFPMRMAIKMPTPSELNEHFSSVQDWIQSLVMSTNNTAIQLEWHDINHRQLGRNKLPCAVIFSSLDEVLAWLGKKKESQLFLHQEGRLSGTFPALRQWTLKNPHRLLKEQANLPRLMNILQWVLSNPKPNIYLRQLSLPGIDTKFIEQNKKILSEWLDLLLSPEDIAHEFRGSSHFEARYGFREKPTQVRFRILDTSLYLQGLSDLMINSSAFFQLNLDISTVFITENDINGLVFPNVPRAIVIFGRGYGFDFLEQAHWLKNKQIYYWGDIDTHGFAILNQCRHYLPQTKSILMNECILLDHRDHWAVEQKQTQAELTRLSNEESRLYITLRKNIYAHHVRLEQEFVSYEALLKSLADNSLLE